MLNPFPALLDFSLIAPLLLRTALGLTFLHIAYTLFLKRTKAGWLGLVLKILSAIGGLALLAGFLTQIAAILAALLSLCLLLFPQRIPIPISNQKHLLLFLFVVSLSLLFSGAGLFALDSPL